MKKTAAEYATWAREASLTEEPVSKQVEAAAEAKSRGISNWAEFYASKAVAAYADAQGEREPDCDHPRLWDKLAVNLTALINNTSEAEIDNHGSGEVKYAGGKVEDFADAIHNAINIISALTDMQEEARYADYYEEFFREATEILTARIKEAVEAAEEATSAEFTDNEKQAAKAYLEVRYAMEEAEDKEAEAREEFNEAVREYNYAISDIYEVSEAREDDDPEHCDFYAYEDEARTLVDKAEEVNEKREEWHDAKREREAATEAKEEAEEALNDAIVAAGLAGKHHDPADRKDELLEAAREGAF